MKNIMGNGYRRKVLDILIRIMKKSGLQIIDIIHKPGNYSALKLNRCLWFEATRCKLNAEEISRVNFN